MIVSALVTLCRREFGDFPKSTQAQRNGDGSSTLFNLGRYPIVEGSYTVYVSGASKTENTHYSLDKDNGDLNLTLMGAPANGVSVQANFKHANFRDQGWVEAINHGIESLNSRGFFRQIIRDTSVFRISANVRIYAGPTNAVDVYELLVFSDRTISGTYQKLPGNWKYEQDANKVVLGWKPSIAERAAISYLRNLQTYTSTSATLDVLNDWMELVKKKAGAYFYRYMAGKIAKEGKASIDEGHFSFTNLRTMANDLDTEFNNLAVRKKPTRPAKDIQWHIAGGGVG